MTPTSNLKLGFWILKINIKAYKIDKSFIKILKIVEAGF